MCHELHSLSLAVLVVDREASEQWVPQAAGVELKPVEGAPAPADAAAQRLTQMRSLAREFTGRSLSDEGQAWELRLLPQPLYRYESTDPDVLDGALFTLVSSAGTDPEIILVLEARKAQSGRQWVFGAARFSDMNLWLKHKGQEVWSSIRSDENTFNHDAKHRFRFYQDRIIPEIGDGDSSRREVRRCGGSGFSSSAAGRAGPVSCPEGPAARPSSTPRPSANGCWRSTPSDAAGYTIYRDASRKEKVELQREPVYVWTNPVRDGGQDGAVFVWTCRGRAEVLGAFFSFPATGRRKLCHEFHSLSLSVLDVSRPGSHDLDARGPGHRADSDRGRTQARAHPAHNGWPRCAH